MDDVHELQRALAQVQRRRGRDTRYPEELRARVGAWVADRRLHGDLWADIVKELGVPVGTQTLQRWAAAHEPLAMLPVELAGASPSPPGISIVTSMGVRIEGLTITEAIAILRTLR